MECPRCQGCGILIDETACGDPEHCSPAIVCSRCEGTGEVS